MIKDSKAYKYALWCVKPDNKKAPIYVKKQAQDWIDIVDGKKPQEIIELGKEVYEQRKNAGYKGYEQYSSWGEMITKFGRERIDQDNRKGNKKEVVRDKANDILYKL